MATSTTPPGNYGFKYADGETVAQIGDRVIAALRDGLYASGEVTGFTSNGLAAVSLDSKGGKVYLFPARKLSAVDSKSGKAYLLTKAELEK